MKRVEVPIEAGGSEAQFAHGYAPWLADLESRLLPPNCAPHWPMVVIRPFPHHEGIFAYEFEIHAARLPRNV